MRVVLFNGPRTAGKDTLAAALAARLGSRNPVTILPMARPMHEAALAEYGLPPEMVDSYQVVKDEPQAELKGFTPRQVYIDYGNRLRATYGPNVLGDTWMKTAAQIVNHERGWLLVPDVRFQPEVNAAIRLAGKNNVMLMYVIRTGTSWEKDIGRFCEHDWSCTFINNGTLDDLGGRVERLLERAWQ